MKPSRAHEERFRISDPTYEMLANASLISDADVRRVHCQDGRPIQIVNRAIVDQCVSGRVAVLALEHYTTTLTLEGSSASQHNTVAAKRFNWALFRNMCAERLSFRLPRQLDSEILCGCYDAISHVLHHIACEVNGGAFRGRKHDYFAERAAALLPPLRNQVAAMSLLIQRQQEEWGAVQRTAQIALWHRQRLQECVAEETLLRDRIEWRRAYDLEFFFPELRTLLALWQSGTALLEQYESQRFAELLAAHKREFAPLVTLNTHRIERQGVILSEQDDRKSLSLAEGASRDFLVHQRVLQADEKRSRRAVIDAEETNFILLMRKVFCYFELVVSLDAVRVQENARREVLENFFSRELRGLCVSAARAMPQLFLSRVPPQSSKATKSNFWGGPTVLSSTGARRSVKFEERPRAHPTKEAAPQQDQPVSPNDQPTTLRYHHHLRLDGGRALSRALVPVALRQFLESANTLSNHAEQSSTSPRQITAVPLIDTPSEKALQSRWSRRHLPRPNFFDVSKCQALLRAVASVRLSLQHFYRINFRTIRYAQRRWIFVALEFPRLYRERCIIVADMLGDGARLDKGHVPQLSSVPTPTTIAQSSHERHTSGYVTCSSVLKVTIRRCQRCVPIILSSSCRTDAFLRMKNAPGPHARHTWEAEIVKWGAILCRLCAPIFYSAHELDPAVEYRHALKRLLLIGSRTADPAGRRQRPVINAARRILAENSNERLVNEAAQMHTLLQPRRRAATLIHLRTISAFIAAVRAARLLKRKRIRRICREFLSSIELMNVLRRAQVALRIRRKRSPPPESVAPCCCETVLFFLQRRIAAAFQSGTQPVPSKYQQILSLNPRIVHNYESWIVHHTATWGEVEARRRLHFDEMPVANRCVRSRNAFQALSDKWRKHARYGRWIMERLRFRLTLRKRPQQTHRCPTKPSHCSSGVLDLIEQRVKAFPGLVCAEWKEHTWLRFTALINRTCPDCVSRVQEIRMLALNTCRVAAFVRRRFAFVIHQRTVVDSQRRASVASDDENSLFCRTCSIFLDELRLILATHTTLSEQRIEGYTRWICLRCRGPLQVFVKPLLVARRAARLLQSRYRWKLHWRRVAAVRVRHATALATRGSCVRCDTIISVLRRRCTACLASSGCPLKDSEAVSYVALMCSSRCCMAADRMLSLYEQALQGEEVLLFPRDSTALASFRRSSHAPLCVTVILAFARAIESQVQCAERRARKITRVTHAGVPASLRSLYFGVSSAPRIGSDLERVRKMHATTLDSEARVSDVPMSTADDAAPSTGMTPTVACGSCGRSNELWREWCVYCGTWLPGHP